MTIRVDSNQLIAGKTVVSLYAGHGVQAQNIPSTGDSGAAFLYNDIAAQGMAGTDEVRGELLSLPASGTLAVNEDSSFTFSGAPDGVYTFTYRGFRNGTSYGDYTVTLEVGVQTPVTESVVKSTLTLSSKTLGLSTGTSIPLSKSNFSYSGKQLTVVTGTDVPLVISINKGSYSVQSKPLTVVAGTAIPMTIDIGKSTLTYVGKALDVVVGTNLSVNIPINKTTYSVFTKPLTVQVGSDMAINKGGLTISYKDFFIPPTGYPVFDSTRVFYIKKTKQSTFYI